MSSSDHSQTDTDPMQADAFAEGDNAVAAGPSDSLPTLHDPDVFWEGLPLATPDRALLERNHIIGATRSHPAHAAFDMLRTRLLQALQDHGWNRVAITSPTRGCGSSFVAANLAFSVSHLETSRVVLLDMDIRSPGQETLLGIKAPDSMSDYLSGVIAPENFIVRAHHNLALALNSTAGENSSELFQNATTADVLEELEEALCPDLMLFDMPPALEFDDVLGFLPNVDAVLIVAGGGISTAAEIAKTQQILAESKPVVGVLLNQAEGPVSY